MSLPVSRKRRDRAQREWGVGQERGAKQFFNLEQYSTGLRIKKTKEQRKAGKGIKKEIQFIANLGTKHKNKKKSDLSQAEEEYHNNSNYW